MTAQPIELRPEIPDDADAITALVTEAFGSAAEAKLVTTLRQADALELSLVAIREGRIVGHVAFSPVEVADQRGAGRWLGLAPLAIAPSHQRQGIGSALARRSLQLSGERGAAAVFVLGDPNYYARLGFDAAVPLGWRCIYPVPQEAFRVWRAGAPAPLPPPGTVLYHPAFDAL